MTLEERSGRLGRELDSWLDTGHDGYIEEFAEAILKELREAVSEALAQDAAADIVPGVIFAVYDHQGGIRVFEVDGEEVQPLVPDKAAPADLFRLIGEKRKAMEEVQPTAIVEARP